MTFSTLNMTIPGKSTGAAVGVLPIIGAPSINPAGTLVYVDFSLDTAITSIALDQTVRNHARGAAARLCASTEADTDAVFTNAHAASLANGECRFEMTSGGGLHVYMNPVAGSSRIDLTFMPDQLRDYILANPTNDYYFDAVIRRTSKGIQISSPSKTTPYVGFYEAGSLDASAAFLLDGEHDSDETDADNFTLYPRASDSNIGRSESTVIDDVAVWNAAAISSLSAGLQAATPADVYGRVMWNDAASPGGITQGAPSFVVYSIMIEDLTVSGRTWATVSALREAQFDAEFGTGGKYDSETWTDVDAVAW